MNVQSRQFLTNDRGKKTAVVLPIKQYERFLHNEQLLEDLQDLAAIADRKHEKRISLAEAEKKLKRDGRL